MIVILRDWSVCPLGRYTAPELGSRLQGKAYDHPLFQDGEGVTTSKIVKADGLVITTLSRDYLLEGPPDPEFVKFCESIDTPLNLANPISFKE